jgi:hypothetical protein
MSISQEATELYTRRDQIVAELAQIDARLKKLRAQYMIENKTCGLHPESFRRAVERVAA